MESTDTKRKYKAKGNAVTCNIHDCELVFGSRKIAKEFAKRMNKAVSEYFKAKKVRFEYEQNRYFMV